MNEDRDSEMTLDTAAFVAELRRLADALESGSTFTVSVDGEEVTIPQGARFAVALEREDGEVELEFEAVWAEEGAAEESEEESEEHEASEASGEGDAKPEGEADKA